MEHVYAVRLRCHQDDGAAIVTAGRAWRWRRRQQRHCRPHAVAAEGLAAASSEARAAVGGAVGRHGQLKARVVPRLPGVLQCALARSSSRSSTTTTTTCSAMCSDRAMLCLEAAGGTERRTDTQAHRPPCVCCAARARPPALPSPATAGRRVLAARRAPAVLRQCRLPLLLRSRGRPAAHRAHTVLQGRLPVWSSDWAALRVAW
jgi:hypothetical protein